MNMLTKTIMKEKERIDFMLSEYNGMLASLPKGSISKRESNGRTYFYLKYRDGSRVVTEYVKKKDLDALMEQLDRRKHIETLLKSLKDEQAMAEKILGGIA